MTASTHIPDLTASDGIALGPPRHDPSEEPPVDPVAVQRAKQEIQVLVREIAELAKSDIPPGEFYEAMLSRIVSALAAEGGAVWTLDGKGGLSLAYQINYQSAELDDDPIRKRQHASLLTSLVTTGQELLVPPHCGTSNRGAAANPTEFLLVLATLKSDEGVHGVVEVFQRPGTRPTTQRGYLRFVQQMCDLAGDYLKNRRLRHLTQHQGVWQQIEEFTRRVHAGLDVRKTAFTIANEGRRLVQCDRVSVVVRRGHRIKVEAISGQDTLDMRSNIVQRLSRLAQAVTDTGETVWYTGDRTHLAPQIERALDAYLDLAHAKTVGVLPLAREKGENDIVGAIIVEQIDERFADDALRQRAEAIAPHAAAAIANAVDHESLFLLPLWRALGRMRWVVSARALPKTAAIFAVLAAGLAALMLIPADMHAEARGTLQPTVRRDVFAGIDGVVIDVPAVHGQTVEQGQPLATLRNTDLEVQITDLVGRRETVAKQMRSLERSMLDAGRLGREEQNRISGQMLSLRKSLDSLGRQLELYREKQRLLEITSPIAGQVVTWQVDERLLRRPVRAGQSLLTVADPTGTWELVIHMPEDRMGLVAEAAAGRDEPLEVSYILATEPGVRRHGRVTEIHAAAEVRGEEGNTVVMRVAIDKNDLQDLRPGATVVAKVDCGQRSLGYVWLHDVISFVQSKVLFRL